MMKFLVLTLLMILVGCVNPLEQSRKVNTKKKNPLNPPTITTNNGSDSIDLCSDVNAINLNKKLPCVCNSDTVISLDGKSCSVKYSERSCEVQPLNSNGGFEYSDDEQLSWSLCQDFKCNPGYIEINGSCLLKDIKRSCSNQPLNSISGWEESNNGGINWSSCQFYSCANGYANIKGTCTQINQKRSCLNQPLNSNGGFEYTQNSGVNWTSCQQINCNSGFTKIGEICSKSNISRSCSLQPENSYGGSETSINAGINWNPCSDYLCKNGFLNINGSCKKAELSRSCLSQPNNSTGGIEKSFNAGLNWGSCENFSCIEGFTQITQSCVKLNISRSCSNQPLNSHGGQEISVDAGKKWSSCLDFKCDSEYSNISGVCLKNEQSRSCEYTPENSLSSEQTTINAGNYWSDCKILSCKDGYELKNNKCSLMQIVEVPNYDPQYYVKKFESSGIKRHIDLKITINVIFDSSLSNTSTLGMCVYSAKRYIILNPTWWNRSDVSNSEREYAIYHELGHCILNRDHKSELVLANDTPFLYVPKSMMYPSIMNNRIYKINLNYYHDELFDSTMSSQNIALYYETQKNNADSLTAPLVIETSSVSKVNGKINCAHKKIEL